MERKRKYMSGKKLKTGEKGRVVEWGKVIASSREEHRMKRRREDSEDGKKRKI